MNSLVDSLWGNTPAMGRVTHFAAVELLLWRKFRAGAKGKKILLCRIMPPFRSHQCHESAARSELMQSTRRLITCAGVGVARLLFFTWL